MLNSARFVSLTRHGDAEITIGDAPYLAQFTPAGAQLTPKDNPDAPARTIPWAVLAALPIAYAICVDGWLHPTRFDTEREALDRATDLRSTGCRADVVRVPRTN